MSEKVFVTDSCARALIEIIEQFYKKRPELLVSNRERKFDNEHIDSNCCRNGSCADSLCGAGDDHTNARL